jgi:hypothetical protein
VKRAATVVLEAGRKFSLTFCTPTRRRWITDGTFSYIMYIAKASNVHFYLAITILISRQTCTVIINSLNQEYSCLAQYNELVYQASFSLIVTALVAHLKYNEEKWRMRLF